jgi:hypothetical protein
MLECARGERGLHVDAPFEREKRLPQFSEIVVVDVVIGRAECDVVGVFGVELDAAHVGFTLDR